MCLHLGAAGEPKSGRAMTPHDPGPPPTPSQSCRLGGADPAGVQPGWSLTGHVLLHQVLQGQTDGVVLHGAGDNVGRIPLRAVDFVEMRHHRVDHQIV